MNGLVTVVVEKPEWRATRNLAVRIEKAALHTLARAALKSDAPKPLTILLTDNAKLKALNRAFRNRDKPTNVLSFPSTGAEYLGDVAIAYGVTRAEARAEGKSLAEHALHLTVHGVLHLLGYDHEKAKDAKVMERLETAILAEFDIADPYVPRGKAA